MQSYDYEQVINELVDIFTVDNDEIEGVVIDMARRREDEYDAIVSVDESEFDKQVLADFFNDLKRDIADELKTMRLL